MVLRHTLALLALYLTLIVGLAFVMEGNLRASARPLMHEMAQRVDNEVMAALYKPSLKRLLGERPFRDWGLTAIIADAKHRSDVLASIAVVDARGKVVASDDKHTQSASRQSPQAVFKKNIEPVLLSSFKHHFQVGKYALASPLMQQNRLLGYISMGLDDRHIIALYHNVYATLLLVAIAGLVTIAALGALLQVRLGRASTRLAAQMEAMARGDSELPVARQREFAKVSDAASRLGDELNTARGLATCTQNKLNAVINTFDVGIILMGPDGAVEYINRAIRERLAGDHTEELGARVSTLVSLLGKTIEKQCLPGGGARVADVEIADWAGVIWRLRVALHALDTSSKACLLIAKDRDRIDALDEDLRAATRARSQSKLYAAAVHDIKAPLNAISLHFEMLKHNLRSADTDASDRQQRHLEVLNQEFKRLNRLLHSVLNQWAPASEERNIIDLRQLVSELKTQLLPQARHQRVSLEIEAPPQPVSVFGNAGHLKQALLNVALNALESVAEGGCVDITLRSDASAALLTISDNGPGIPDPVRPNIFDMHFTTKNTGTGIGLYVARAVAEAHDGGLCVQSRLGAGARFTISLPLYRTNRPAHTVPDSAREAG
jgi:signal transduction histidine kinase